MLVDPLRRHVVGRSDERVRHRRLGAEEPAQAEVPELDDPLRRDEDVGRLDVCTTILLFSKPIFLVIDISPDKRFTENYSGINQKLFINNFSSFLCRLVTVKTLKIRVTWVNIV